MDQITGPGKHWTWSLSHIKASTRRQNFSKMVLNMGSRVWRTQDSQDSREWAFAEHLVITCLRLLPLSALFKPHDSPMTYIQLKSPNHDLNSALPSFLTSSPTRPLLEHPRALCCSSKSPAHSHLRTFALAVSAPLHIFFPNSHISNSLISFKVLFKWHLLAEASFIQHTILFTFYVCLLSVSLC